MLERLLRDDMALRGIRSRARLTGAKGGVATDAGAAPLDEIRVRPIQTRSLA